MPEKLSNHETEGRNETSTEWDTLKEVPMAESANANSGEIEVKQYETELTSPADEVLHHPAAEQLKQLEAELARAEQDGDETAINGCKAALKMVVERNQLEVSPEEWDKMSDSNKERFYKIKMKEAKILGDRDSFNFWNANFKRHH